MIAHSVGLIARATDALVQTRAHALTIQCLGLCGLISSRAGRVSHRWSATVPSAMHPR
jgi:hypothetical protein